MKKIFLTLAVIVCIFTSCNTLSIAYNYTDAKGVRTTCTSDIDLFGSFDIALGTRINKNDTLLAVLITSTKNATHSIFDKDDRMLIRLSDNSVITLTNLYDKEFERKTDTEVTEQRFYDDRLAYTYSPYTDEVYVVPYTLTTIVPRTYTTTTSKSYALYMITKHQLNDIINKGVIKLRIEIENDVCDMRQPEKATEKFAKLYDYLKTAPVVTHSEF